MGTVIAFPYERLAMRPPRPRRDELATVIILPVVRMERWDVKQPTKPAAKSSLPRPRARSSE